MRALITLPFRLVGELVRLVRWLLYVVLLFCGNRLVMAAGGFMMWLLYAAMYPQMDQTGTIPIGIAMVGGWILFCFSSSTIARLIVRPGMRLEPITLPAPPPRPQPVAPARAKPAVKAVPVVPIPAVPNGPMLPQPTRVALLVPPAPAAASPDEASMVARLSPELRALMQQRG